MTQKYRQENEEDENNNRDFYALLNISKQASQEEIKSSFKRLAITYHPDRQVVNLKEGNSPQLLEEAKKKFEEIRIAYETLSDSNRRAIYDRFGSESLQVQLQLSKRATSVDELQSLFEKWQKKNQSKKVKSIDISQSNVVVQFSMLDNKDKMESPKLLGINFAQSTQKIPLSSSDFILFHANFNTTGTKSSGGELGIEYLKQFDSTSQSFVSATTKLRTDGPALQIQTGRKIGEKTSVSAGVETNFVNRGGAHVEATRFLTPTSRIGTRLEVNSSSSFVGEFSVVKDFGSGVTAKVSVDNSWDWVLDYSLFGRLLRDWIPLFRPLSISYSPDFSHFASSDPSISTVDGFSNIGYPENAKVTVSLEKKLGKKTRANVSVNSPIQGSSYPTSVTLGGWRKISEDNQVGLQVSFGESHLHYLLGLHWGRHKMNIPLAVNSNPSFTQIGLSVVVPALLLACFKLFWVEPQRKIRKKLKIQELRRQNVEKVKIAKASAESAVKLMISRVARKRSQEEARKGLIVISALYGNLEERERFEMNPEGNSIPIVDVTIPVQCLVEDSQLHMYDSSKAFLLGFYDPCPGEEKQLWIRYLFKDKIHEVTIDDTDILRAPLISHCIHSV